jgi:hypothetical protein
LFSSSSDHAVQQASIRPMEQSRKSNLADVLAALELHRDLLRGSRERHGAITTPVRTEGASESKRREIGHVGFMREATVSAREIAIVGKIICARVGKSKRGNEILKDRVIRRAGRRA